MATSGCAFFKSTASVAVANADTIKIGFVGSFSGDTAANGKPDLDGINMALAQINATGVLGGRKIQVLRGDDRSDPEQGAPVANALIDQGAVALIGPNSSGIAEKMLEGAAKKRGVVMTSPSATSPAFSDPKQIDTGGYFF
ncbi:MAG: ABC transporter substrate-binding protein, partial [Caulobacter sp.]|nr:ABC transporter substrate-binding protein [Vitreoscilla sp.]